MTARARATVPRRATVLDVAAAAGVSRQTVTRAMNDMSGISASTKVRVLAAAKELKYRPSRFGRGLVLGHQPTLGFVLDDLTNPYYPALAASVVSTAADRGWNVLISDIAHSPQGVSDLLVGLAQQVDAVIGYIRVPGSDFDQVFGNLPVVALETKPEAGHRGVIELDFGPGLREAVQYLHGSGRQRIAMVDAGPPEVPSIRGEQYLAAMAELGLDPLMVYGEQTVDGGQEGGAALVDAAPDIDGIIAFNDHMAFGVMKALRHRGIAVPAQCAVIGIDGLELGRISTPELSSLALDLTEVGRLGVDLVTRMHAGELPASGPEVQRTVHHTLLHRESS
ncbi:LacI family DNA-binding transcriptional regulator [Glaciihabitans sp. UYNi722]|uniref:LacI family DNA-binding transcriptional regulator n=1 Tax=Glaciihabitans sp. UYNi722 TaxID=3156344 RepID=UPI0033984FBE